MTTDTHLEVAISQVQRAKRKGTERLIVVAYFDEPTFTVSYLVHDPVTLKAAIIDSVCNFDQPSGRTSFASADAIIADVKAGELSVDWILETHAHADHLSAAPYLKEKLGGQIGIGASITTVQKVFGNIFHESENFARDGSQFDHLFNDGERFWIGDISAIALHVPGHTPADVAYIIGDAAFVGDTMFMPDYGSARADFPGGDARQLYRSIRRLTALPDNTRVFLCHDYQSPQRKEFKWETTMGTQRSDNIHFHDGIEEDDFVAMRTRRDASLGMPRLILPAIQINVRAGNLPEPESNGISYLKLPLNTLKG